MDDIYAFIDKGLSAYNSLHILDFSKDVFYVCQDLNCLLNKDVAIDYAKHLENNNCDIKNKIRKLSECFAGRLYINVDNLVELLSLYQENTRIDKEKYRDHYYHSVQCFLLGLSLCALIPVLKSNFTVVSASCSNITTILYTIFFYHDLGYLYGTKDADRINNTVRTWLYDIDIRNRTFVERIRTIFGMRELPKEVIADFTKKNELDAIWNLPFNRTDNLLIREKFSISKISDDVESHHSYESAVVLYRFVQTKDLLSELSVERLPAGTINLEVDEQKNQFLEVIKIILLHDFNIQSKLLLQNDFLACLLMIVDEIQNYGRPYQNELYNNKILLPTKVGLEITSNNKVNLLVDDIFVNTLDENIQKSYRKHASSAVYKILDKKIDKSDLDLIFERTEE